MRTMLNSLIVVTGMSAAFVAGFWARDQICFYRDLWKSDSNGRIYRNVYDKTFSVQHREHSRGYKEGYEDGWRDCLEANREEPKL